MVAVSVDGGGNLQQWTLQVRNRRRRKVEGRREKDEPVASVGLLVLLGPVALH